MMILFHSTDRRGTLSARDARVRPAMRGWTPVWPPPSAGVAPGGRGGPFMQGDLQRRPGRGGEPRQTRRLFTPEMDHFHATERKHDAPTNHP
jgi:hypothetical protein